QRPTDNQADQNLKIDFFLSRKAKISPLGNFCVIIDETDDCEAAQGKERDQDKRICQIGPKQRGDTGRQDDQHSPHGGCSRFFLVRFRPFFADVLPDLEFAQPPNQPRPENEREEHRREAGVDRSNGDVAKHVERAEVTPQNFKEEVVEHLSVVPPGANTLPAQRAARSMRPQSAPSSRRASPSRAASRPEPRSFRGIRRLLAAKGKTLFLTAIILQRPLLLRFGKHRRLRRSPNPPFRFSRQAGQLPDAIPAKRFPIRASRRQPEFVFENLGSRQAVPSSPAKPPGSSCNYR